MRPSIVYLCLLLHCAGLRCGSGFLPGSLSATHGRTNRNTFLTRATGAACRRVEVLRLRRGSSSCSGGMPLRAVADEAAAAAARQGQQPQQHEVPRWVRELQRNLEAHKHDPTHTYMQLATASAEWGVSCRSVVFRGFLGAMEGPGDLERQHMVKVVTDVRSSKMAEIAADPRAELCWYFRDTREQFRVRGVLRAVTAGESDAQWARARAQQWSALSGAARASFYREGQPGLPIHGFAGEAGNDVDAQAEADATAAVLRGIDTSSPSPNYVLLVLQPYAVDHLYLLGPVRFEHSRVGGDGAPSVPPRAGVDLSAPTSWNMRRVVV